MCVRAFAVMRARCIWAHTYGRGPDAQGYTQVYLSSDKATFDLVFMLSLLHCCEIRDECVCESMCVCVCVRAVQNIERFNQWVLVLNKSH